MSGAANRRGLPATPPLQLARVSFAPVAAPINSAFAQIERADAQNLKRGQEIFAPSLLLAAPNGATYRVSVVFAGGIPTLALAPV